MRNLPLASVLLLALALLVRPGPTPRAEAQTTELLAGAVDAGFEAAGAGWVASTDGQLTIDGAGPVHGGARSGRVEATAAGVLSINTQYWLAPTGAHATHTLRLWLFDDDPRTSTLSVTLEFVGSDLRIRNFRRETVGDSTAGWRLVTFEASGVDGTAYVRVDVRASTSGAGARFYVDDVSLEREPLPAATATSTPAPTATPAPTSAATPTSTVGASPSATATATTTSTPPAAPRVFDVLTNGGFEDGAYGWADVGADVQVSGGVALVTSRSTSTKYLYQTVRVTPGAWYAASAYLASSAGVDAAWVRVAWYASGDGSGSQLATVDSEALAGAGAAGSVGTGPVQAPAEAHAAQLRIMLRPLGAGETTLTVDDVRFEVTSPPPAPPPLALTPTAAAVPTAAPQSAGAPSAASPSSPVGAPPPTEGAPAPRLVAGRPVEDAGPAPSAGGSRAGGSSSGGTRSGAGGASGPGSTPAARLEGFAPEAPLRITELMPDPLEPGNDAEFEWVEVSNVGAEPVALAGMTLRDNSGVLALPDLVLHPGTSLVVAGSRATVPDAVAWRTPGGLFNGLGNSGDRLALLTADGRLIDALSYGADTTYDNPPLLPPGPGRSLKRFFGDDGTFAGAEVSESSSPGRFEPAPARLVDAEAGGDTAPSTVASEDGDGRGVWFVLGGLGVLAVAGAAGQRLWALRHRSDEHTALDV